MRRRNQLAIPLCGEGAPRSGGGSRLVLSAETDCAGRWFVAPRSCGNVSVAGLSPHFSNALSVAGDFTSHVFDLLVEAAAGLLWQSEYRPKLRISCQASQNNVRASGFPAAHFEIMSEIPDFINKWLLVKSGTPDLTNNWLFIKSEPTDLTNKWLFVKSETPDLTNKRENTFSEIPATIFRGVEMFSGIPDLLNNNALSIS
jgi:hypothetical protein